MSVDQFFWLAREREGIRAAREQGKPKPWTNDPVLQRYRFCNVFREDDKTTRWFNEHVRFPMRNDDGVALATVIFRFFNRIETGEVLLRNNLFKNWDSMWAKEALHDAKPLVTGAYMIKSPPGMNKLSGLCECIDNVKFDEGFVGSLGWANTLESMWSQFMLYPYLGNFMAYEVVTDLRHTKFGWGATDIDTWASPGPGAARGLGRVLTGNVDQFRYTRRSDRDAMLEGMQYLLGRSRDRAHWPSNRQWEMREVEHWLCEYDKWCRTTNNEGTPKELFRS